MRDNGGVITVMRIFTLVVSFAIVGTVFLVNEQNVSADTGTLQLLQTSQEDDESEVQNGTVVSYSSRYLTAFIEEADQDDVSAEDLDPEPIQHIVEEGETLTKIAKEYDTEWVRLWNANADLEHPDVLAIEQELIIPFADEELEDRELPEPEVVQQLDAIQEQEQSTAPSQPAANPNPSSSPVQQSSPQPTATSGNLYAPGYCTWYVKNKRPDLPNNLGNANTWVSRASGQGYRTGSTPQVGAVAYQPASSLGHVAYVEAVHNDGTVTVSEMNWRGLYVVTERRVAASTFQYIYR